MRALVVLVLTMLATGCGPAALPPATAEKVAVADMVGTWQYHADFGKTTVDLELRLDGTFTQTITWSGGKNQVHRGSWSLDGNRPRLIVLYPVFGEAEKDWVPEDVNWWVVESRQKGVVFAIFGASNPDPDSFEEITKVP